MEATRDGADAPPRVVVVGNLTIDDVVLPDGTTRMGAMGGNTVYAVLGARLWQPRSGIVTRRGEDFPEDGLPALRELGVATEGVVDIAGPTVRNWVVYEDDGRRHWLYRTPPARSDEVAVHPDDIPSSWLREPAVVVHIAAMALPAAEALVARVRREAPDALITLDTHEEWFAPMRERVLALASQVHAFLPSHEEASELLGIDDPAEALRLLGDSLPTPIVVVKMGSRGCLVRSAGEAWEVGVSPGPVQDVTGAGDAFCGGFAGALSVGSQAVDAARCGAVSAGFAVARFSSLSLASVGPEDAARRLAEAPPLVTPRPDLVRSAGTATSVAVPAPGRREDARAIDVMCREIAMAPDVIASQLSRLGSRVDELAASFVADGIERIVLTGCGDSWFAGSAATLAFRGAGVDVEAPHAMELARYRVRYLPPKTAVVCISYSGDVGRTIEAAAQASRFGHRVIALTGREDGRMAQQAGESVLLDVPTLGFSPGTSTYVAMLTVLLDLAAAWGSARGVPGAEETRASLHRIPEAAATTIANCLEPARVAAGAMAGHGWIQFIGTGPNEASARFGAAKLFEGPQLLGVATDLEEWAHEEYFVTEHGSPVVVVAPAGASFDRALEIYDELRFIGADVTLVTDVDDVPDGLRLLRLAAGSREEHGPILAALPLSLVAFHLAESSGKRSYNFASPEAEHEHYDTIHRATIGEPA
ncbi:MAG: PfkB family carbohydrate kinase [Actinomycetota bacterium]